MPSDPPNNVIRHLSHSETARALRAFIASSGLWGAWGQVVGIGTAVFTGYVLWLGATDAQVAYFVSIASFASLGQIISSVIAPYIQRKKLFVFCVGMLEMCLRFAMVLAPVLLPGSGQVLFVSIALGLALFCGHTVSPIYNGWLASVIPEDIRARFIGRQTVANLLCGMVAAYAAGRYVDLFSGDALYGAFVAAFVVATVLGIGGYVNLMRVPFREQVLDTPGNLLTPFRDRPFLKLLIFFLLWNFALGLSGPFYSVFMLRVLQIDYATVAVFNSLFMGAMVVGYRLLGGLVDRFGGKAILQILVPPCVVPPVLWVFNRPDAYWLIPTAMVFTGLIHSGILVAVNAQLLGILSKGRNKTTYFAAWSTAINMTYAVAPLLGSALVGVLEPVRLVWLNVPVGNLQLSFLVTSVVLMIPVMALASIEDLKQTSPSELFAQVGRGNLLGYVYSALAFRWAWDETGRARAFRLMGRSRSPMALHRLIEALEDPSPEVRRQAAQGLGDSRSAEAVSVLLDELRDDESDIRSEAVEALGKIGDPKVMDPLLDALDDADTRVRISAIRALAEIGGEEANEVLFWKFADVFDRATFPTLVDVLGAARDLRIVRPALAQLGRFRSQAIRLQVLNSICRALGADRQFYELASQDRLTRAEAQGDKIRQALRAIDRSSLLRPGVRRRALDLVGAIQQAFDLGDSDRVFREAQTLVDYLEYHVDASTVSKMGAEMASRIGAAILAIRLIGQDLDVDSEIRLNFVVVCLWCIGDALERAR